MHVVPEHPGKKVQTRLREVGRLARPDAAQVLFAGTVAMPAGALAPPLY